MSKRIVIASLAFLALAYSAPACSDRQKPKGSPDIFFADLCQNGRPEATLE